MAVTPQQVRNKLFTSVRLRQGYDEDEVDAFLDEIESELTRLLAEIEELKAAQGPASDPQLAVVKADADARLQRMLDEAREQHEREVASLRADLAHQLAAARGQADGRDRGSASAQIEAVRREAEVRVARAEERASAAETRAHELAVRLQQAQQQAESATRRAQAAGTEVVRLQAGDAGGVVVAPGAGLEPLPPPSPTEDALRRTLVLAQRTADEAIAEARAEAQRIVTEAHRHAADTISRVEVEHSAIVRQRTVEQQQLMAKLEELRSFERDYRSRLRAYLHLQLRDLEAGAPEPPRARVTGGPPQALGSGTSRPAAAQAGTTGAPLRPPPLYGERPGDGGGG